MNQFEAFLILFVAVTLGSIAMTAVICVMVKLLGPLIDWAMR